MATGGAGTDGGAFSKGGERCIGVQDRACGGEIGVRVPGEGGGGVVQAPFPNPHCPPLQGSMTGTPGGGSGRGVPEVPQQNVAQKDPPRCADPFESCIIGGGGGGVG